MSDQPQINDVRLRDDGELEYFDGTDWVAYPDLPDDNGQPFGVTREDVKGRDG
ncbi:hypothetical protein [Actinomadura verrucosospora]|uniref:Uncharacterized protein n=1 Tax=Actinomadura verrucosospora TaxID=46165 RepID=A0A7D3VPQ2_ACTVE|nr:hypothetical protein [Actinomadura verrucosospora]QKG19133.1 hypothetical protein ACTIVE_0769 [Actinomadura verrucosospora]